MNKINFVNNSAPALNAENLNKLQDNVDNEKLDKTGGTLTGDLITKELLPNEPGVNNIGSNEKVYRCVFANYIQFEKNGNGFQLKWENGNINFYVNGTLVKSL